jgi:hypothetical protein
MCKFSFGMFVSLKLVGYPYIFGDAACQPIDRVRNIAQERARNPVFHRPVIGKARGPNGNFGRTWLAPLQVLGRVIGDLASSNTDAEVE